MVPSDYSDGVGMRSTERLAGVQLTDGAEWGTSDYGGEMKSGAEGGT